ncbi:MAG TPA: PilZ domain-containing protein [Hyphomicrobium sp.]|nr:PilZ domain-containing protein [Hyphomicrobium sp.]
MAQYPPRPPRVECTRPATVSIDGGQDLSCLIRNISGRGACISVLSSYLNAETFELEDKFTLERWRAEVIWRGVGRTGVKLHGAVPSVMYPKSKTFGKRR